MKKLLVVISVLIFLTFSGLSYSQDNTQVNEATKIKEICQKYYNEGKDCPYDSIVGSPILINGDENQNQRFDEKKVEVKKPEFKSN